MVCQIRSRQTEYALTKKNVDTLVKYGCAYTDAKKHQHIQTQSHTQTKEKREREKNEYVTRGPITIPEVKVLTVWQPMLSFLWLLLPSTPFFPSVKWTICHIYNTKLGWNASLTQNKQYLKIEIRLNWAGEAACYYHTPLKRFVSVIYKKQHILKWFPPQNKDSNVAKNSLKFLKHCVCVYNRAITDEIKVFHFLSRVGPAGELHNKQFKTYKGKLWMFSNTNTNTSQSKTTYSVYCPRDKPGKGCVNKTFWITITDFNGKFHSPNSPKQMK